MKTRGAVLLSGLILLGICAALFHQAPAAPRPGTPRPAPPAAVPAPPRSPDRSLPEILARQSPARFGIPTPLFLPAPDPVSVDRALLLGQRWTIAPGFERAPEGAAAAQPVATPEIVLMLAPGADAAAVARDHGLRLGRPLVSQMNAWVFQADTPAAAVASRQLASLDPRVTGAFLNRRIDRRPVSFVPNDPYFPAGGGFPGQWHLLDSNLPGAWAFEATGKGVVLGIVDDGMETFHPDLGPNFDAADSINTGAAPYDGNVNPSTGPRKGGGSDDHGTSVSGVAAAVGGNGIGVTGAAPQAALSVQRIDFKNLTDVELSDAVGYHATGPTPAIHVKNHSYGSEETYVESVLEAATIGVSASSGTIHAYAAGNGLGSRLQDSNKFQPQNSADILCVAAIGSDGLAASYSSFGSNVFVTAPSSSATGFGIMTTDRLGGNGYNPSQDTFPDHDYTSDFGGTSSATPLVVGIVALGRQANKALDIRLAQHVLVRSADLVHPTDSSVSGGGDGTTAGSAWQTNGAGFKFNNNYGFGRINAGKFVTEAVKWKGVTVLQTETVNVGVGTLIPDASATGVNRTFVLASTQKLETVLVSLDIDHSRRGDLEARLTSPSGTVSRLMINSTTDLLPLPDPGWAGTGLTQWTFATHAFWGENPAGTWNLRVIDVRTGSTGTWNSFSVTARMGLPVADNIVPTCQSITRAGPDPTGINPLPFTVKFSEFVTGVDPTDFALVTTGSIAGASITSVTGGVDTYTVNVNPGIGIGTIKINLIDNNSIVDGNANPLGGAAAGDGNFTTGEIYTVDSTPATIAATTTTPDGLYTTGDVINLGLTFSEPLTLLGGNLTITFDSGGTIVVPPFTAQTSLTLTHTVVPGESSADLTIQSLQIPGATLRDPMGTDAILSIAAGQNLAFAHAIQVDSAPPVAGIVSDGFTGPDLSTQTSITTLAAHWSGFSDPVSGIKEYRWALGTAPDVVNVLPYTSVGLATSFSTSRDNLPLVLGDGQLYYVIIEATDNLGNTTVVSSDGITVTGAVGGIPQPPGHLDALAQATAVQVVWVPSPDPAVTSYRLWWKPAASPWTAATLVDNLAGTSTTVSGLTLGVAYDFLLHASTATGNESTGIFASTTTSNAITVDGAGNFATIQAAITSASGGGGGTVTVQAGTYAVNLTLPANVVLTGISPHFTILSAANGAQDVITATGTTPASTVSQLTVTGGQVGINAGSATLVVKNVVVHHTASHGISSGAAGNLQVVNCTILHNGGTGIAALGTTAIRNTIVSANALGIVAPAAATVTYTSSYANTGADFAAGIPLATDSNTPILFTDEPANDYTEAPGSPSIDSGDPNDAFANEPDFNGGRINMGAYGNTSWAATTPVPVLGGGGGGGGCGLTGLEALLLLALLRARRATSSRSSSSSPS